MSRLTQEGHLLGKQKLNMDEFAANWDGEQSGSSMWYANSCEWRDTHSLIMQCALCLLGYVQCPHFTLKPERTEVTQDQHRLEDNRAHTFLFEEHTDCRDWNGTRVLLVYTRINVWSHMNQLCQTYVTPITAFVYSILQITHIFIPHKAWMEAHGIHYWKSN